MKKLINLFFLLLVVMTTMSISCTKDSDIGEGGRHSSNSSNSLLRGEELVYEIQNKIIDYINAHENSTPAEIQSILEEYSDLVKGYIKDDALYLTIDSTYNYICHPVEEPRGSYDFDDTEIEELYAEIIHDLYPDSIAEGFSRGFTRFSLSFLWKKKIFLWDPWKFHEVTINSKKRRVTPTDNWQDLKKFNDYDIVIMNCHGGEGGLVELPQDAKGLKTYLKTYLEEKKIGYDYGNQGNTPTYFLNKDHLLDWLSKDLSKTMIWTVICHAGCDGSAIQRATEAKGVLSFAGATNIVSSEECVPIIQRFITCFDEGASAYNSIIEAFGLPKGGSFYRAHTPYRRGDYSIWYNGRSNTRVTNGDVIIGNLEVRPMSAIEEKPRGSITLAYELAEGGVSSSNIKAGFWIHNKKTKEELEIPFSETTTRLYKRYNHKEYISRLELLGNTDDLESGTYEYKTYLEIDGNKEYSDESYEFEVKRINKVVPEWLLEMMTPYIPIYEGDNPPMVEGAYLLSPKTLLYDSGNSYSPGRTFADNYLFFTDQDEEEDTINFVGFEIDKYGEVISERYGEGAFISGDGNNFSIFFDTFGESHYNDGDTYSQTALIISGTKTSSGINNIYYAFAMVDKYDPYNHLMAIGVFRVFVDGDGIAYAIDLNDASRTRGNNTVQTPLLPSDADNGNSFIYQRGVPFYEWQNIKNKLKSIHIVNGRKVTK